MTQSTIAPGSGAGGVYESVLGWSVGLERIHADGGPGFEALVERACELIEGAEGEVGQCFFVGCYLVVLQLEAVHKAEVHGAYFVGVVVDDGEELLGGRAGEGDFLADFAFHAGEVGGDGVGEAIDGVDVAADTE